MKVKVTKEAVVITEYECINEGEYGVNTCCFELPQSFSGLTVTAAFNNIPVPVVDGKCCIPNLKKGTAALGVYAYSENDGAVELMYSPKPALFFVNIGSYNGECDVESIPTVSEFEQFCNSFTSEILKSIGDISVEGGAVAGGMNSTARRLLIEILQTAVYSTNISGKIAQLEEALASGGEDTDGGDSSDDTTATSDDITVTDGIMTIISVGSEITVSEGVMTIL